MNYQSIDLFQLLNDNPVTSITWPMVCTIASVARECNRLTWLCDNYPDIAWIKGLDNKIISSNTSVLDV